MKLRILVLGLLAWSAQAIPTTAQENLPSLERALVRAAPELVRHLQKKGYSNVGVLKFLVAKAGQKASDNVGTLNLLLARQLETALILGNDVQAPLGIVEDASAIAARTPGANHLSKVGCEKLFSADYPLAWGKKQVKVDAFVTGRASISRDLRTITISFLVFDRQENKLEAPFRTPLQARLRAEQLATVGESYLTRQIGIGEGPVVLVEPELLVQAVKISEQRADHPLQDSKAPVVLQVLYNGSVVSPKFENGRAYLAEPREGQQVELQLSSPAKEGRYGVVLRVNGVNTRGMDRLPDLHSRMWVLKAGSGPYTIAGFYQSQETGTGLKEEKVLPFRVGAVAESKGLEIKYGANVGTITLTVFREATTRPKPALREGEELNAAIVEKLPPAGTAAERPENHGALLNQLIEGANRSRGVIDTGPPEKGQVEVVRFTPDHTPVMTATLIYYRP